MNIIDFLNNSILQQDKVSKGKINKIAQTLGIFDNINDEHTPYNFEVIEGIRGGVEYTELWILVNARYDRETQRFKRINVDNYSFGWQLQGGGTYPGEETIGDTTNQGVNLWKANGKLAYAENDPMRDLTGEDIGALQEDGTWREYGIMLGWNNVFMNDSYGGMTIGGSGFEIDGSGANPFRRVSLGKYGGTSEDSSKDFKDYNFLYNGDFWNLQHGFWNSDLKDRRGFYWGMLSPVDYFPEYDKLQDFYSTRASLDEECTLSWVMQPKDTPFQVEKLKKVLNIDTKGNISVERIDDNTTDKQTIGADVPVDQDSASLSYPDGFNKTNTIVNYWILTKRVTVDDKEVEKVTKVDTLPNSLTDYGIYVQSGTGNTNVSAVISKKTDSTLEGINLINNKTGDKLTLTDNGRFLYNNNDLLSLINKNDTSLTKIQNDEYSNITTENRITYLEGVKNGFVDNLKLYGKTLRNLSNINTSTIEYGNNVKSTIKSSIKPNTTYTQIINITSNTLAPVGTDDGVAIVNEASSACIFHPIVIGLNEVGIKINKITTNSNTDSIAYASNIRTYDTTISGSITVKEMILEGDWTNKELPNYFEGLKSAGESINAANIKIVGKNLYNNSLWDGLIINNDNSALTVDLTKTNDITYTLATTDIIDTPTGLCKKLNKVPLGTYSMSFDIQITGQDITISDFGLEHLSTIKDVVITEAQGKVHYNVIGQCSDGVLNCVYYIKNMTIGTKVTISNIQVERDNETTFEEFIYNSLDTKVLRSLPDGTKDICDYELGKYIFNVSSTILRGNAYENWQRVTMENETNYIGFSYNLNCYPISNDTVSCMCDKFDYYSYNYLFNNDVEGVCVSTNHYMYIRINKNKLSDQTPNALKSWISANGPLNVFFSMERATTVSIDNTTALQTFKDGYIILNNDINPNVNLNYSISVPTVLDKHTKLIYKINTNLFNTLNQQIKTLTTRLNNITPPKIYNFTLQPYQQDSDENCTLNKIDFNIYSDTTDSAFELGDGIFRANETGEYEISLSVEWEACEVGIRIAQLVVGNDKITQVNNGNGVVNQITYISKIFSITKGDTFYANQAHNAGKALNIVRENTFIKIRKIKSEN